MIQVSDCEFKDNGKHAIEIINSISGFLFKNNQFKENRDSAMIINQDSDQSVSNRCFCLKQLKNDIMNGSFRGRKMS